MKYYYPQHIQGYARVKAEGKTTWGQLFGERGFDDFSASAFLTAVLPTLEFDSPNPEAFNYGCGTGPDACFLAERGFDVDAVDIIPTAIEIARQQAALRGLDINYAVQDVCELSPEGKQYHMVVDSFCLQCIVFDDERQRLFSAVSALLKPHGYYLISTAVMDMHHRAMIRQRETVTGRTTGIVYTRYLNDGNALIDLTTGIVLTPVDDPDIREGMVGGLDAYSDAVKVNDQWFLPHRRHLTQDQLVAELSEAGFQVVYRYPEHEGELACVKRE